MKPMKNVEYLDFEETECLRRLSKIVQDKDRYLLLNIINKFSMT